MKKLFLIALSLFLFTTSFASNLCNQDRPRLSATVYHKSDGEWVWHKLCVGYAEVYTENVLINSDEYIHYVTCKDPGEKRCKVSRPINYDDFFSIYSTHLNTILNDAQDNLLGEIERDIINGVERGSKSQTISHRYNGKNFYFLLNGSWTNGDGRGNGEVTIEVYDITGEIGLR